MFVLGNKSTFSLLKLLDFKIGKKMLREMVSTAHTHTPCLMKIAGVEAITAWVHCNNKTMDRHVLSISDSLSFRGTFRGVWLVSARNDGGKWNLFWASMENVSWKEPPGGPGVMERDPDQSEAHHEPCLPEYYYDVLTWGCFRASETT